MAGKPARRSEPEHTPTFDEDAVSEFTSEHSGAQSPFGNEIEFPVPVEQLPYHHPSAADRPNR